MQKYPNLLRVVELLDARFSEIGSTSPLRASDFASFYRADLNQIASAFELFSELDVLVSQKMLECEHCQNLMSEIAFRQAVEDEDDFECSSCGALFPEDSDSIVIYRMSERCLDQTKSHAERRRAACTVPARSNFIASTPQNREWPNPQEHTTAKFWTKKSGAVCLSTKTNDAHDGAVEFAPTQSGESTFQMRFMLYMAATYPGQATLGSVIEQVYSDEWTKENSDAIQLSKIVRRLRSLVSDIRKKKFARAGINPDILSPLSVESSMKTGIGLRLAHLHRLDDMQLDDADLPPQ